MPTNCTNNKHDLCVFGLESSSLYNEVPSPLSSGATCVHDRCVLLLRASGSSRAEHKTSPIEQHTGPVTVATKKRMITLCNVIYVHAFTYTTCMKLVPLITNTFEVSKDFESYSNIMTVGKKIHIHTLSYECNT